MASFGRPVGESTYIHTNFILVPKRLFREYMLRDKNEVKKTLVTIYKSIIIKSI